MTRRGIPAGKAPGIIVVHGDLRVVSGEGERCSEWIRYEDLTKGDGRSNQERPRHPGLVARAGDAREDRISFPTLINLE